MNTFWYIIHFFTGCEPHLKRFKRGLYRCEKCGRTYFDFMKGETP